MATITKKSAAPSSPPLATRAIYNARGLADTEGDGLVGDMSRGWDVYDSPTLAEARAKAHERRLAEAEAYFVAQLAK